MIIACDFDGVIHDNKNPVAGRRMGGPIDGAKAALDFLKDGGHTIIVFTVWGGKKNQKTIAVWMNYYSLPFDSITNIKPQADVYLDDKAILFMDWPSTLKSIELRELLK